MLRTLTTGLAAVALTAAGLMAATPSQADDSWAGNTENAKAVMELYEAAKAAGESEVIIYGGYSAIYKPVWDVFSERFPEVTIIPNPLGGPALVSKLDVEFASGQHGGDVLMAGMTELLSNVAKDRADGFVPPNAAGLPSRYIDPDGRFVIQFADVFGVVYNSTKISEDELPGSVKDLLQPRFDGMMLDDPLAGGAATLCWIELYNSGLLDAETMRGIYSRATIVPSLTPYYANLSTGSVDMFAWGSFARHLKLNAAGAPVEFKAVPGMVVPLYGGTAILKGGPNSAAAKLFQAWFITPEAQQALIDKGSSYPLLPTVDTPAEWPKLKPLVDALKTIDPADYMSVRADFEEAARKAMN